MPPRAQPDAPHSRYRSSGGRHEHVLSRSAAEALPVPDMPAGRNWAPHERQLWEEIWHSPQSLNFDDSDTTAVALLVVYRSEVLAGTASAWHATEARHLMDRLGLTPLGRQQLGWRIGDE